MTKKELSSRMTETIRHCCDYVSNEGIKLEPVNNWFGTPVNVWQYAATSEMNMERQLRDLKGEERKTTFMSDLSIGEWYGMRGVLDTVKDAVTSWKDDETYMAEFILCLNLKLLEHHARGNVSWVRLYVYLFEDIRDLIYDYYEGDEKKTGYLYSYLD